ncbi:MAG TPA: hypothetical protein VHM67_12625 [Gemmatimonadaceae bacterium]|nr:hypothetical protein [Gemmatimonadaceae bacterium]
MARICDDLRAHTPRIVELWERAIELEPWILPRQLAKPDFMPELIDGIATCSVCTPPTRESVSALAQMAARHAAGRALEGAEHGRVLHEYYFARSAIWSYFGERQEETTADDLQTILYVDVAVSLATRAALLGYYRVEFERQGTWSGALDRLVDETPLLWEADRRRGAGA